MSRAPPRALALALLALACVAAPRASAGALRVYDAGPSSAGPSDAPAPRAIVPPAPPQYLTENLGWLKLVYHPSTRDRVRPLIGRAAGIRAELGALLGREALLTPVEVRIAAAPAELDRLAPRPIEGATTAAAFGELRLAVISAASRLALDPPDLDSAFRHQLAHLALDEASGGAALPRWLHEGFAVHAAGERSALRAQTLCLASLRGRLVPLSELDALLEQESPEATIAGAQAADFARFLLQPDRQARFGDFIERARSGEPSAEALARSYGSGLAELELAWRGNMARRYGFVPVLAGTLVVLGLFIGGALAVRRMRTRRAHPLSPRRKLRPDPPPRPRPPRPTTSPIVAARGARPRGDADSDPDVPKVEHDGRWYTLH
jgi:hypothetical protein